MNQIYTAKSSLAGQNVYCKKELRWKVYIQKSKFGRQNIHIKSSLGGQNMYCKKQLRWTKYIL